MNDTIIFVAMQGVLVGAGFAFFVSNRLQDKYGEILRPLVGKLLFRKPKIRPRMDPISLFAAGNLGNGKRPVTSIRSLKASHRNLQEYIAKNSWFKVYDNDILGKHYHTMRKAIEREAAYRAAYQREQEARARNNEQKATPKKQNPIAGWRQILGIEASCNDAKVIKNKYRKLVSADHPDKGGKGTKMSDYNRALDAARQELNFV